MENEEKQTGEDAGAMRKRRETMPDGKRYVIFYTFGEEKSGDAGEISSPVSGKNEVSENV